MRKTATVALLFTFLFAAMSPSFAQRGTDESKVGKLTRTQFETVRAMTDGSGVLVRWYMTAETSVSGYLVYRVSDNSKELLTKSPIVGSATHERTTYGEMYQFFDSDGQAGFDYLIEGIRTDGSLFSSKLVTSETVKDLETEVGMSSATFITAKNSTNSDLENRSSTLSSELQDLVSLHERDPDLGNQRIVASKPGAKISVRKDGFYRVSAAELISANFQINSDPTRWRLFTNGVEQAIVVGPNREYIEFYGRGIDTPETDTRIYYLVADTVVGKRIGTRVLRRLPGAATATRFPVVVQRKQRTTYYDKLFNGPGENYTGNLIFNDPFTYNFNLSSVDFSSPTAEVTINCFGFTNNPHALRARINGNDVGVFTQFGEVYFSGTYTVPTSQLQEGANVLELRPSSPGDQNLFDNIEVSYQRTYATSEDRISFSTPGYRQVNLSGFSTSSVRVFDVTFEGDPVLLANVPVEQGPQGFTARIPSTRMMVGYALENTALLQSPAVVENLPSTLSASTNQADMLIISHSAPSFLGPAETWAAYRRSVTGGALNARVVDVADIYDEFSYGVVSSEALKSFMQYTVTDWVTDPRYVMLIGDSTVDLRNYEGYGNYNLVPTESVTNILQESVSDEALGDFDGDGLADIAIGRIPARNGAQVTTAYNKTVRYEATQQSFNRGVLFAHDVPLGFDFENMSQQLSRQLPPGTPFNMVSSGDANARGTLVSRMNEGKFLVNYSGHGAAGLWANSSFFNNNTVPELTNIGNPSIYSALTCLNGFFVRQNVDSLAEVLLFAPNGGAAAVWASSTETTPDIQLTMALRYFNQMSSGNIERMGDLIKDAKTAIDFGADVRLSWVLIGDPALRVP